MDKAIIFYGNNKNFIIYKSKQYYYETYSGIINWNFDIIKLLFDENYYNEIINSLEFNRFMMIYDYQYKRKTLLLPVSKELIEYYSTKNDNKNVIRLSNIHLRNNVDSFYEFSLELVINDYRTTFQRSFAFKDMIYIDVPKDEVLKSTMTKLFGEPKNIPELSNEKYDCGKNDFFYIVPKSQIDKIIGIKKHRDISTIGQSDEEQFTGEQEEFVLDLQNFDENIYKIFKEHGMLEIEGY